MTKTLEKQLTFFLTSLAPYLQDISDLTYSKPCFQPFPGFSLPLKAQKHEACFSASPGRTAGSCLTVFLIAYSQLAAIFQVGLMTNCLYLLNLCSPSSLASTGLPSSLRLSFLLPRSLYSATRKCSLNICFPKS